jgi:hypothetical protein
MRSRRMTTSDKRALGTYLALVVLAAVVVIAG